MSSKDRNGILSPPARLWESLARRIGDEGGESVPPGGAPANDWNEPEWREAAPGLWYQLLSFHPATGLVTMLVQVEPGKAYPPHVHAGVEELHLLDGELWIDDRKLYPGDYNRAEARTADQGVWSPTGCTCMLITSRHDALK